MAKEERKHIDLALQGGGSHGALTWGVLDRLLEEERLEIDGVSGTSAGAMNAVVLADGLHRGGREGAREALHNFWRGVSEAARFSPIQPTPWDQLMGNSSLDNSPTYLMFESLTQLIAPAKLNPMKLNPLRDLVCKLVDFERVNACRKAKVYVTATNVRTGRAKVFSQPEITVDTVMASACLPFMFPAVEIDGEAYWDGGYSGNPALFPLVDDMDCQDLVVIQVNPLIRQTLPDSARDIINRINEITFNTSLIKELRSIQLLQQLIDAEGLEVERYRSMRLHLIHAEKEVEQLSASSKLNAQWDFVSRLYRQGRGWADLWLKENFDSLGKCSTFDLNAVFSDTFRPLARPTDTAEAPAPTKAKPPADKTATPAQAKPPADKTAAPAKAKPPVDKAPAPAKAKPPADKTAASAKDDTQADKAVAPAKAKSPADKTAAPAKAKPPVDKAPAPAKDDTQPDKAPAPAKAKPPADKTAASAKDDTQPDKAVTPAKAKASNDKEKGQGGKA